MLRERDSNNNKWPKTNFPKWKCISISYHNKL